MKCLGTYKLLHLRPYAKRFAALLDDLTLRETLAKFRVSTEAEARVEAAAADDGLWAVDDGHRAGAAPLLIRTLWRGRAEILPIVLCAFERTTLTLQKSSNTVGRDAGTAGSAPSRARREEGEARRPPRGARRSSRSSRRSKATNWTSSYD